LRDSVIAAQAEVEHLEMAYYRNMVVGTSLVGQAQAAHLLRENLDQEEETARTIEQSAPRLLWEVAQTA
jgi:ferritin-like metal-binding protein YciE